ncbi:MAG TPA: GGDEF domain-containing protein, partial [Pseudogracilibacillus sp.]|nr:GGDEF domain-containing protein [Pseudogracilibacillus sp.]
QDKFPIALIMLDIDHFKRYNDTYGHLAGDKCLQRVAKLIDEMLTERSDFEARYGGEEFVILLANSSEQTAATVAEKIREKIASTSIHNGVTQSNITISLGVSAMVSKIKVSPEILISAADEALYKAK